MSFSAKEHFNSLDNVGSKTFFVHNRYPTEKGGLTLAIRYFLQRDEGVQRLIAVIGLALCHNKDLYNRKLGAKIALGRLEAMRNMYLTHEIDTEKFMLSYEVKDGVLMVDEPEEKAGLALTEGGTRPHGVIDELIDEANIYLEENVWPDIYTNPFNPIARDDDEFDISSEGVTLLSAVIGVSPDDPDEDEDDLDDEDDFGLSEEAPVIRRGVTKH